MELYILRHGKAEDRKTMTSDFKRDLTFVGKQEMEQIGKTLCESKFRFDYICTSPLNRAKQTAEIVAKKLKTKNILKEWDELKPEGHVQELYEKLSTLKLESKVLLVGHEPHLSTLIIDIISKGEDVHCSLILKKAGFAKISVTSTNPKQFAGDLNWLLTPKLIKKFSK